LRIVKTPTRAYLSLGTNLGDRLANLGRAVRELAGTDGMDVVAVSSVYETAALGPGNVVVGTEPAHLNCAVLIETQLSAPALHVETQRIERAMGRGAHERWEARVIDIDLLLFGDERISTAELTVPHASMFERAFVLRPLVDLDADLTVAGVGRLAELLPALRWQGCELFAAAHTLRPVEERADPIALSRATT
jgi:2-amino-4-hydroxy-6-hydroxymethyldihydropteridine diphosphokinase